ncbi:MAG: MerR family transcriptional regulator [Roseburia sp.]|jgi:DNA-binding transcriptional MerR regulator|nr:MerR family transcriptional regulator [Roseburia sp.]
MEYTLKEFAELFGITEHTVRYYTDIDLLPCRRDGQNRRVFNEESANWMRGILYLKRCGAPIKVIREYCELCRAEESEEHLMARYQIIKDQRAQAHRRAEEAAATAAYMDQKLRHYEDILAGVLPDDTNPGNWSRKTGHDCGPQEKDRDAK